MAGFAAAKFADAPIIRAMGVGSHATLSLEDGLSNSYMLLGFAQAAHSIEEMLTHPYDFFWVVTGILHSRIASFLQFRMNAAPFEALNMAPSLLSC